MNTALRRAPILSKSIFRRWRTTHHHSLSTTIPNGAHPQQTFMPPRLLSSLSTDENTLHSNGHSYDHSAAEAELTTSSSSTLPFHETLLHKKASVRRTFAPNSNAQVMLVCGGQGLAAHASFDPEYKRAKGYIQNHPVGPAVLSPILISGLVGALIESTLPQSFFVSGTMNQLRPLIVGVEVEASIQVVSIDSCNNVNTNTSSRGSSTDDNDVTNERYHGYELLLDTEVKRVSDGAVISNGTQKVWLPNYGH